jgi:hypothetical protein
MSRGLGVIERLIEAEIAEAHQPDRFGEIGTVLLNSWTLACEGQLLITGWKPSAARRKAVVRAMHSFVRKHPQYALLGGQGRRILYLYETADPLSALWAKLNVYRRQRNPVARLDAQQLLAGRPNSLLPQWMHHLAGKPPA